MRNAERCFCLQDTFTFTYFCVCASAQARSCITRVCLWRSEGNWRTQFSFLHESRDQAWAWHGGKNLYLLSYIARPYLVFFHTVVSNLLVSCWEKKKKRIITYNNKRIKNVHLKVKFILCVGLNYVCINMIVHTHTNTHPTRFCFSYTRNQAHIFSYAKTITELHL